MKAREWIKENLPQPHQDRALSYFEEDRKVENVLLSIMTEETTEGGKYWELIYRGEYECAERHLKVKGCKDFLKELPEDIAERALTQLSTERIIGEDISKNRNEAVAKFTIWYTTLEKHDFWNLVSQEKYNEARELLITKSDKELWREVGKKTEEKPATKFDEGKLDLSLFLDDFPNEIEEIAKCLTVGEKNHGERNHQSPRDDDRMFRKAKHRHNLAYAKGEMYDKETGLHHHAHEICNLLFDMQRDFRNDINIS